MDENLIKMQRETALALVREKISKETYDYLIFLFKRELGLPMLFRWGE